MNDLISRQAAIDLCDWYDNPSMREDLEKLPSAQPGWIPCSERLPEQKGIYPVWTAKGFGEHLSTS